MIFWPRARSSRRRSRRRRRAASSSCAPARCARSGDLARRRCPSTRAGGAPTRADPRALPRRRLVPPATSRLQPLREQQLLLRRDEHRRVDRQQRLARGDRLSGEVRRTAVRPTRRSWRDGAHARFVVGDLPDGADLAAERARRTRRERHADAARVGGGERDGPRTGSDAPRRRDRARRARRWRRCRRASRNTRRRVRRAARRDSAAKSKDARVSLFASRARRWRADGVRIE